MCRRKKQLKWSVALGFKCKCKFGWDIKYSYNNIERTPGFVYKDKCFQLSFVPPVKRFDFFFTYCTKKEWNCSYQKYERNSSCYRKLFTNPTFKLGISCLKCLLPSMCSLLPSAGLICNNRCLSSRLSIHSSIHPFILPSIRPSIS